MGSGIIPIILLPDTHFQMTDRNMQVSVIIPQHKTDFAVNPPPSINCPGGGF